MKISIIGTGYVGLVTGICLSKKGHNVVCYDKDENIFYYNYLEDTLKHKPVSESQIP